MTTISMLAAPFTTTTPELVVGFESTAESNNLSHQLASGRTIPFFREASGRRGRFSLFYGTDETASRTAELLFLNTAGYFELEDTDRPSVEMTFWVSGRVTRGLDRDSRDHWLVTVEYEEVPAP